LTPPGEFGDAVHHAAERSPAEVMVALFKAGADPFSRGRGGLFSNKNAFQIAVDAHWRGEKLRVILRAMQDGQDRTADAAAAYKEAREQYRDLHRKQ
jgi:hypothetical protein